MAPKSSKRVASSDATASGKNRKVITKRADKVLETMQGEVEANRIAEMKQYVWDAMGTSQAVSDRCYCVAVDHAKKMASAHHLHRNNDTVAQVPGYHKEEAVRQSKCLQDRAMMILMQDKRQVEQLYLWLTGYSNSTQLGIVSLPVRNFLRISLLGMDKRAILQRHRMRLYHCERFCHNFDFGPFGFVRPVMADLADTADPMVDSITHHDSQLQATLPCNLQIPVSLIGNLDNQWQLIRWATATTAMVKGPGGMSFTALKLFTKENQQTILAFEAHIACILQDDQDLEIGQTPSLQNPEIVPRLKGKATIGTGSSTRNTPAAPGAL